MDKKIDAVFYVRRCKKKTGHELHDTLHAAHNDHTFCGKELNEMWSIESSAGLKPKDITCKECQNRFLERLFSSAISMGMKMEMKRGAK